MGLIYNTMLLDASEFINGTGEVVNPDYSVVFNGTSNYISQSDASKFGINGDFTWSVMLNSAFDSGQMIFDQRTSNVNGIQPLYITDSKHLQFHVAPAQSIEVDASPYLKSNEWNHIAVVIQKSRVYFYVNGLKINPHGDYVQVPEYTTLPLFIGRRHADADYNTFYYYKGTMADVRLYDHALSYEEIKQIPNKLILHYSFDEFSGGQVCDGSGFGLNATATSCTIQISGANIGEYCASFDASSKNYITLPTSAKVPGPFTYNIWAYMDDWANYANDKGRIISCTQSGGYNLETSGNSLVFAFYDGTNGGYGSNINTGVDVTTLGTNTWHMFSFTLDINNKKATAYVDGVPKKSVEYKGIFQYNALSPIFLGAEAGDSTTSPDSTGPFFDGKISDFRLYAKALTDKEIGDLYSCKAKVYNNSYALGTYKMVESHSDDNDNGGYLTRSGNFNSENFIENHYLTTDDGAKFLQIFGHDVSVDSACFTTSDVTNSVGANRFSRLYHFNDDRFKNTSGKYELMLRYPRAVVLPNGYQRVSYISSHGVAVDTGYNDTSYVYWHDIQFDDASNTRQLMGFNGSTGTYWGKTTDNYFELEKASTLISSNARSIVKYKYGSSLVVNGNSFTSDAKDVAGNYYLFGLNSTEDYNCLCKLYRFTIYSSDPDSAIASRVADFYPCVRRIDNRAGLYDVINNRFISVSSGWGRGQEIDASLYNRWEQQHNPLTDSTSVGYSASPINIQMLGQWNHTGIGALPGGHAYALLECQLGHDWWHGGLGHYQLYQNKGFPSPTGAVLDSEELYIRIDNTPFNDALYVRKDAVHMNEFMEE